MKQAMKWIAPICALVLLSCGQGVNEDFRYTGVIEATSVQVPALTGGQIREMRVETGQVVEAGQLLAVVDTINLHFEKQRIEGVLEEISVQEKLASTALKKAQNDLKYLRDKYQRFTELLKQESVQQQAVDDLKNRLQAAEAAKDQATQQFAALSARRKQAAASLDALQKKINDARIISPVKGIVSEKYFERGEAIPPLRPLVEVLDISHVWVKIYVSEPDLPRLKVGGQAKIWPDGSENSLPGNISWISPKAEFTPKTILTRETRSSLVYAVQVEADNPEQVLKQGMPVEVELAE